MKTRKEYTDRTGNEWRLGMTIKHAWKKVRMRVALESRRMKMLPAVKDPDRRRTEWRYHTIRMPYPGDNTNEEKIGDRRTARALLKPSLYLKPSLIGACALLQTFLKKTDYLALLRLLA